MVLLEFSVSPMGKGESVGEYVARCVEIVEQSGLDYEVHAMGTLVEGELAAVLDVMRRSIEAVAVDCERVSCTAKLDVRRGHEGLFWARWQVSSGGLGIRCAASEAERVSLSPIAAVRGAFQVDFLC